MLLWTLGCMYLFKLEFSFLFSSDKYPEIAETYDNSIFNFLRKLHTVFHSGCSNFHSHQQCISVLFSPHLHQHLFVFLIIALLTDVMWYLIGFFLSSVQLGWYPLLCLSVCWSIPLHHFIYCWFLLVYFYLFIYLNKLIFIYLLIFGCIGSSLLCAGFL